jgi:protein SCO1/2
MKLKVQIPIFAVLILCLCGVTFGFLRLRNASAAPAARRTFQVHGTVRRVDASKGAIRITHEAIPDYMPAMTMEFPVKDSPIPTDLALGDDVQFELLVTKDDSWIANIVKIMPESPGRVSTGADATVSGEPVSSELQKGETVPDFQLIDQNGNSIRLSDLRGKPIVLTFIYTRCPLPNFCPLMSKNFQALQLRLQKEFPDRFQLLSVTIDPKFDRPEILKEYAGRYSANEKCWTFATGTQEQIDTIAGLFGLVHEPESGLISHNLRTALIGADGRLRHVWKSNVWTPYEVARMLGETMPAPKTYSDVGRL